MSFDSRVTAYFIALIGLALAFLAAFVPFFNASYHLETAVMVVLTIPFALYVSLSGSLRGPWLLGSGLVLLVISLAVVVSQRFIDHGMNVYDAKYWLPLFVSAILLPVAYVAGRNEETSEHA